MRGSSDGKAGFALFDFAESAFLKACERAFLDCPRTPSRIIPFSKAQPSSICSSVSLLCTPSIRAVSLPFSKRISVGMERTP